MADIGQPVPSRSAEHARLADPSPDTPGNRKAIGLYLSERAGGAVREVYSANGQAWQYFPYQHARSCAHRWSSPASVTVRNASVSHWR